MMEFIRSGGFMMYFILAGGALAAVSAVRALVALRSGRSGKASADGIIFWGGLALLMGVLGTVVGFSQMARAVEAAGDVAPAPLWGGIRVALITTIAGCGIFVVSLMTWAPLRWLVSRRAPARDRRLGVLEAELQALRSVVDNLDERIAFEDRLRTSR